MTKLLLNAGLRIFSVAFLSEACLQLFVLPQHFIIYLNFSFNAFNKRRRVIKTKENQNKRIVVVYKFFYGMKERMFLKKVFYYIRNTSYILKILSILLWNERMFLKKVFYYIRTRHTF